MSAAAQKIAREVEESAKAAAEASSAAAQRDVKAAAKAAKAEERKAKKNPLERANKRLLETKALAKRYEEILAEASKDEKDDVGRKRMNDSADAFSLVIVTLDKASAVLHKLREQGWKAPKPRRGNDHRPGDVVAFRKRWATALRSSGIVKQENLANLKVVSAGGRFVTVEGKDGVQGTYLAAWFARQ